MISFGDGYIIIQDETEISFVELTSEENCPEYLAYNYVDKSCLSRYLDGVEGNYNDAPEDKKVGVASDGIRFIVDRPEDDPLKEEFVNILKSGKEMRMKLFINKHPEIFQDDVSIVF